MESARIMDTPEDYVKLGINPSNVEPWEEGRRNSSARGNNEVWYFDANMDDGSKLIIGFRPKTLEKMNVEDVDSPNVNIVITTPDGQDKRAFHYFTAEESYTGEKDECDLRYGTDTAKGNFKYYEIHVEPTNGVGADLRYEALVDPFRQGTGIVTFGNNDEFHHTDLCVAKNSVTGTLYYDGKEHKVTGVGYHDHQWMNASPMALYHHWLWGRMYTDKFTVYIYDFVASEKYGFKKVPMFGLMDNKSGKVIFETDGNFSLDVNLEPQKQSGREFPKESRYIYQNADGKRVEFNVKWTEEIEYTNYYEKGTDVVRKQYDAMNINPIYMRYFAEGDVTYYDSTASVKEYSNGNMIYEYAYFGKPDPCAHVDGK